MELRLQKFVSSMGVLSDIRNLDPLNPTIFKLQHPVSATEYITVAAIDEPSHLGLPINATWTVLDPKSPYYMQALKLKGAAGEVPEGVEPLTGLTQVWVQNQTYDDIFRDPQYYDMTGKPGPEGPQGPPGPPGAAGPAGADAVFDFDALVEAVKNAIGNPDPILRIQGPTTVVETGTAQYTVILVQGGSEIPVAVPMTLSDGARASITTNNLLTAQALDESQNITLSAEYTINGKLIKATLPVTLQSATLANLKISGVPASILEGQKFTAVATASYVGAPARVVNPTWTVAPTSAGSINVNGEFTAAQVQADTPFTLVANYSELGVDMMDAVDSTVINIAPDSVTVSGPATVYEGATAQYTATATANNGTSGAISPVWSVEPSSAGSISTSGLFTAAQVQADTPYTISALYDINGTSKTGTKAATVLNIVPTAIDITGTTSIFEGLTTQFTATVRNNNGTTQVVTPIWSVTPTSAGTISTSGLFTAALVTGDVAATIKASYVASGVTVEGTKALTVKNIVPTSLALTATKATINEGETSSVTARVTRNDGSQGVVTPTYSVSPTTGGAIDSAGVFTGAQVNSNTAVEVTGTYTDSGVTVTGKTTITVADVPVVLTPYFGSAASNSTKNAALILSLTQRGPTSDRLNDDMVIIDGVGKSMFYAYPVSYGLATFTDLSNGFQGGWDGAGGAGDGTTLGPITVSVNGVPYYLYKTDQSNISPQSNPTHWKVS